MKVGIFLSYVGLGSNLLHLSYCHEIAKKYGPVSVVTICKNLEEAISDDPLIKEVIYIDKYYKRIFDIFKLSKVLKKYNFESFFIFYPSVRFFLASKFLVLRIFILILFLKKKFASCKNCSKICKRKY